MAIFSKKGLAESLEGLTASLFALEVNTILKPNMTGERWTSTDDALRDVRDEYAAKLVALGFRDKEAAFGDTAKAADFATLADDAAHGIQASTDEGARLMLTRIHDNAEIVQRIAAAREADPKEPLGMTDFVTLRKIWEIGTEEIAMQTVVHLDGDVMTRVQPRWAGPAGQGVLAIHNTSVTTATSYWKLLVDTLSAFVNGLVGLVK